MRNQKHRFEIRQQRVRANISKLSTRLRLTIFKSNTHLSVQIIDDKNSCTLVAASTLEKALKIENKSNCNKIAAEKLANILVQRASLKGITKVVFDKGGNKFHGIIKTFADTARQTLDF